VSVEEVRAKLGEEDAKLVVIEKVGDYVTVQLKEYDPTKKIWDRVNGKLKVVNGEWVGGIGKESHWKIPIMSTVTSDKKAVLIKDLFTYADSIEKQAVILKEKLKELQQK